jgi:hypothetical protein
MNKMSGNDKNSEESWNKQRLIFLKNLWRNQGPRRFYSAIFKTGQSLFEGYGHVKKIMTLEVEN